jgi:hypothetical protein
MTTTAVNTTTPGPGSIPSIGLFKYAPWTDAKGRPRVPRTNAEFLVDIFGEGTYVWTCSSPADPNTNKSSVFGKGEFHKLPYLRARDELHNNTYYCISTFQESYNGDTYYSRARNKFLECFVIPIDDVGTKGEQLDDVIARLPPSYVLETSEGNFQGGWFLSEPCGDPQRVENLIGHINKKSGDPGATGVNRVVRLLYGKNRKASCGPHGWKVNIHSWTGIKYDIRDIERAWSVPATLGLTPAFPTPTAGAAAPYGAGGQRGSENAGRDDEMRPLDRFALKALLKFLHPDENLTSRSDNVNDHRSDREWWLMAGRALNHEAVLSGNKPADHEAMLDEFLRWSEKSIHWDESEAIEKYNELNNGEPHSNPTTISSLIYWATKNGFKPPSIFDQCKYYAQSNEIIDLSMPRQYCRLSFPNWCAKNKMTAAAGRNKFLFQPECETIDALGYDPSKGATYTVPSSRGHGSIRVLNTFEPPHHPRKKASTDRIHEHLHYLFPGPDRYETFVRWLAWRIQNMNERPQWALLLTSPEVHGVGRSWLHEMMKQLLGHWNVKNATMEDLLDKDWDDYRSQTLHTTIHECRPKDNNRYVVDDRLRDIINGVSAQLNLKGDKNTQDRLYNSMLFLSNHSTPLIIPNADRRIWVHQTPSSKRSTDYYTQLYAMTPATGEVTNEMHAFYWELMGIDLGHWNALGESPWTDEKAAMILASISETEQEFNDLLTNDNVPAMGSTRDIMRAIEYSIMLQDPEATFNEKEATHLVKHKTLLFTNTGTRDNKVKLNGRPTRVRVIKNRAVWAGVNQALAREEAERMCHYADQLQNQLRASGRVPARWAGM